MNEEEKKKRYEKLNVLLNMYHNNLRQLENEATPIVRLQQETKQEMADILSSIEGGGVGFIGGGESDKAKMFDRARGWGDTRTDYQLSLLWCIRGDSPSIIAEREEIEGAPPCICDGCNQLSKPVSCYKRKSESSYLCSYCELIILGFRKAEEHMMMFYCDHFPPCEGVRRANERYG